MKKIALFSMLLLFLTGFGSSTNENDTVKVQYLVRGTAPSFDVTFQNEDGGISQESNVSNKWWHNFKSKSGEFVYISAQNTGGSGTVKVIIKINGRQFKTSKSSGAFVVATAKGTIK